MDTELKLPEPRELLEQGFPLNKILQILADCETHPDTTKEDALDGFRRDVLQLFESLGFGPDESPTRPVGATEEQVLKYLQHLHGCGWSTHRLIQAYRAVEIAADKGRCPGDCLALVRDVDKNGMPKKKGSI